MSIRMIASGAPSFAASSSAEPIHFSVAGLIDASSSIEGTVVESALRRADRRDHQPGGERKPDDQVSRACHDRIIHRPLRRS